MLTVPVSVLPPLTRTRPRTALVASADRSFRQRLSQILTGLRWQVHEAEGGAQAWAEAQATAPEAIIVDSWLPDLDLAEFLKDFRQSFPEVDLVTAAGSCAQESPRGPYRQELLYALRRSQDTDTAAWNTAPGLDRPSPARPSPAPAGRSNPPWPLPRPSAASPAASRPAAAEGCAARPPQAPEPDAEPAAAALSPGSAAAVVERLPELIGNAACML